MKKRFLSGYGFRGGTPVSRRPFRRLTAALAALILTAAFFPSLAETDGLNTAGGVPASFHVRDNLFSCGDYLYRILADGTAELTEYVSSLGIDTVPDVIDGHPVTQIGPGAFSEQGYRYSTDDDHIFTIRRNITRIQLPEGIIRIGERAFEGCDSLQEVVLPRSLRSIGRRAFAGCPVLMRAALPEGLEELGDYAFQDCPSLVCLNLPASLRVIGANPFADCPYLYRLDAAEDHPFLRYENGLLTDQSRNLLIACTAAAQGKTAQVPDGIRIIGDSAFSGTPFERIYLPASVTSVGSLAFAGCERLADITLPGSVRQIGDNPFRGCTALQALRLCGGRKTDVFSLRDQALIDEKESRLIAYLPLPLPPGEADGGSGPETENAEADKAVLCYGKVMKRIQETEWKSSWSLWDDESEMYGTGSYSVPEGIRSVAGSAFFGADLDEILLPDSVREIGPEAFAACRFLKNVCLPAQIREIPGRLFADCGMLKNVSLPEGLRSVGAYAFFGSGIERLALPESVETIGEYVFSDSSLTEIVLSEKIGIIPRGAFLKCRSLEELILPAGVTEIGPEAFSQCGIMSIDLPQGVTAIPDWCFFCCSIREFTIPESVTWIGSHAFSGDGYSSSSLETIHFNQTVRYIGDHAFWDTCITGEIVLPGSLVSLGRGAFSYNDLKEAVLPDGLREIGQKAFSGNDFTQIVIPPSVTRIGTKAFSFCYHLETVTLPDGPVHLDGNPFAGCPELRDIRLASGHPNLSLEDGFLIDRTERRLIRIPERQKTCVIPDGIEIIADSAAESNEYLEEAVFPQGLRIIGNSAFSGCDLQTVSLPDSLEWIGDMAFMDCCFKQINLPDSVQWIGDLAFYISRNRSGYKKKYEPDRTVTLPAGIRRIGDEAFTGLKLRQLILPCTLEQIGNKAFDRCDIAQVVFPANAVEIVGNPFYAQRPQIILQDDHPALELVDGNLYSKTGRRLIAQFSNAPIREGTLEIGPYALDFSGERIFLPESVTLIRSINRWHDYGLWNSELERMEVYAAAPSASEAYIETIKNVMTDECYYDW